MKAKFLHHSRELCFEIYEVTLTLFKIMIPTILVIKVLEELGGIELLSQLLAPLMGFVGLPESAGIVWATTMLTNIYAGMLVFFTQSAEQSLSVAQVTVLGGMMLIAHGLPVEARIAQKAGVRLLVTLLLRVGGGIVYGWLLYQTYTAGEWLQQPAVMVWNPEVKEQNIGYWALDQIQGLLVIFAIICMLLTTLRILRIVGIERLIEYLLSPLLKLLGIGRQATSIALIGITLGLSFGGGLLIKEARAGHISRTDVFSSMALLALCHSIIEDTLLILLLGAHISGVLWMRIIFAFIVVGILTRLLQLCSEQFQTRFLVNSARD